MASTMVSVCVPTYNGSAYLAETLASISQQTLADFEVLVVDDGSTDGTLDIAHGHAASDARVRVIRNEERAGSSARNANRCASLASAPWIKFLFQDDLMAPRCLEAMLAAGDRGPLVIASHGFRFEPGIDAATRTYYERLPTLTDTFSGDFATPLEFCDAILTHWGINFIGPTSSSMIRRDCFERYGGFDPNIVTFPDFDCWMRVGSHEGLAIAREELVTFRVHGRSISAALRSAADPRHAQNSLESLLGLCLLACAPAYQPLRDAAAQRADTARLLTQARQVISDARWHVIDARYRTHDDTQLKQWEIFRKRHAAVDTMLREIDSDLSTWQRFKQILKTRL